MIQDGNRGGCHGQAIAVRRDYTAGEVRRLAKASDGRCAGAPATGDRCEHLPPAVAAPLTRAQQPREQMAVHASELAVKPTVKSFGDIVDHCCYAWNTLIVQPWKIMSIARRDWATVGQSL